MSREKQIDIIRDLLVEFDEMGFVPSTTVPDHEAYAIKWRAEITKALEDYFKQSEGEWIAKDNFDGRCSIATCSNCGEEKAFAVLVKTTTIATLYPYCQKCGAKMKGGAE